MAEAAPEQAPVQERLADMPQNVRMANARLVLSQAVSAAAATYRLTISETVAVVEGVLSEQRGSLVAFQAAQYERLMNPGPPGQREVRNPDAPTEDDKKARTIDGNTVVKPA